MDGVAAVRSVLAEDGDLLALAPATRIFAGPAPLGTALPFVMLESISILDRNIPSPGPQRFVTERVQVTWVGQNYPQQKQVQRAVRHAAADKINPAVAGISGVTIHTDSAGPDFFDQDYSGWRSSQDFKVRYLETR